jgi:LysR family hydrogen peroxide-inducible transcriptional activator
MTFTQLEYFEAICTAGSFVKAADICGVTQPSLSMQIQKLEEELGIVLLDRSRQPVIPTSIGETFREKAKKIIEGKEMLIQDVRLYKGEIKGNIKMGIIPTVAPYLLPIFIDQFLADYPDVKVTVYELTTEQIVQKLKNNMLDTAILATPLGDNQLTETPIYYEEFVVYVNENHPLSAKNSVDIADLNSDDIWVLNEGHCLANQVLNLCGKTERHHNKQFEYITGSLETLKNLVKRQGGYTLLPELIVKEMDEDDMMRLRYFKTPQPVREISIVSHRSHYQSAVISAMKKSISNLIPVKMLKKELKNIVTL